MLHDYQPLYRNLEQAFQQFQAKAASETTTSSDLGSDFRKIQQIQQQIMALLSEISVSSDTELPDAEAEAITEIAHFQSQLQPIQTEITKQLRLLETDLLFLQAARQPATTQQHKQRMMERLTLLQRYCETVLTFQKP